MTGRLNIERDKNIYNDFLNGITRKLLCEKYNLSRTRICEIINRGERIRLYDEHVKRMEAISNNEIGYDSILEDARKLLSEINATIDTSTDENKALLVSDANLLCIKRMYKSIQNILNSLGLLESLDKLK